jgi:hypothetical protein
MKFECRLLAILVCSCLLAASALAETPSAATKTATEEKGFTLMET